MESEKQYVFYFLKDDKILCDNIYALNYISALELFKDRNGDIKFLTPIISPTNNK